MPIISDPNAYSNMEVMNEDNEMTHVDIIDEVHRVRGLVTGIELLMNTDHKEYRFDPVQDIFIIISEKLEKIEKGLENL